MSRFSIALVIACAALASTAYAGGEMGDAKDAKKHKDEGPRFFGFVRDGSGKPVPEAKVVAQIQGGTRYITHTGKNGMYSFGGFSKNVKPEDVVISCSLDNFKQDKVVRKTPTSGKAVRSVETECRLVKQ
jgi:hypothetical protein